MCLSYLVGPHTGLSWQSIRHRTSILGARVLVYGQTIWVDFFGVETTELETKVQNPYYTLGKNYINSWTSYKIVVAYK